MIVGIFCIIPVTTYYWIIHHSYTGRKIAAKYSKVHTMPLQPLEKDYLAK